MPAGCVESIRAEFVRYKTLAEGALAQIKDAELAEPGIKARP